MSAKAPNPPPPGAQRPPPPPAPPPRYSETAVIERMIIYCKGQALVAPRGVRGQAYNNGVAACVRILEDMLPPRAPKGPRR